MSAQRPIRRAYRGAEDEPESRRALMVSAGAHGALLLLAVFGGQLFSADEAQAVRIADVDIITSAQFDAMVSSAPEGPRDELAPVAAPQPARRARA